MIAQQCQTLADVRAEIDRLDRQIVPLLVERSTYVARAGTLKSARTQVVDPARIEDVVTKAKTLAQAANGNADLMEALYRGMIDAYIAFETSVWDKTHG